MHNNTGSSRIPKFYQPKSHDGTSEKVDRQNQDADQEKTTGSMEPQDESSGPEIIIKDSVLAKENHDTNAATQGFGFRQGISVAPQPTSPNGQPNGLPKGLQPEQKHDGLQHAPTQAGPAPGMQHPFGHHPPHPHVFYNQGHFATAQNLHPQFSQTPVDMSIQQQFYGDQPAIPFPTQSAPTQVLYERARLAATAKASPSNRRAGTPSQRRPWSTEEENALMAGLDRVKGPHWSQILAMFGPGGTINETLKDRNQVQLKDKARNLKLFFLKSGIEVPYYLQCVTGELKTRAPAQAAKNEAKEKETHREERAHIEGVMTLAGVHDTPYTGDDDHNDGMEDAEGDSAGDNDLNLENIHTKAETFVGQRQGYQHLNPPDVNIVPSYNNEVTPAFQAMIDAAAAEAARVGAGGE